MRTAIFVAGWVIGTAISPENIFTLISACAVLFICFAAADCFDFLTKKR